MSGTAEGQSSTGRVGRAGDISRRVASAGLVVVLVSALALRLYGLNWDDGYAWTPHPDERAILSKIAELSVPPLHDLSVLWDAEKSPWNPRWFPYGSFPLYLLKGVDLLSAFVPGVQVDDLRGPGRVISALADVATVALVYMLGATIWSRKVGLMAAALVATAVIHIQLSHFFAVDTLLALFTVSAVYFLVRVARDGRGVDSALAGVFIGLGLATKLSFAPILGAYVVAHLLYGSGVSLAAGRPSVPVLDRASTAAKGAVIGGLVILGVFLVGQPYAVLDWDRFYADFVEQSEMVRRIRDYPYTRQYIGTTPYLYHVRQLTTWGLGWPLGIVAWSGLVFVAVRGMRMGSAIAYVTTGIGLPICVLLVSDSTAGIVAATAVALAALVATIPMRRAETRLDALLLSWVIPYFLIVGAFDVKFMRYLIPITPLLLLFGSTMLVAVWDRGRRSRGKPGQALTIASVGVGAITAAATVFYALSYTGVYHEEHPAVRGSQWIRANLPSRSVILKEHWEEGLPDLHHYQVRELNIYDEDSPGKLDEISSALASGDVLALYSNRLYGTVARLPERYPVSREYYRLLFSGELGYQLEASFTAYPNLFGVRFVDDTFGRPDLPVPTGLRGDEPGLISLKLGYADESFSVYDHPTVMIFGNSGRLDADTITQRIESASPGFPRLQSTRVLQTAGSSSRLMLTPEQLAAREAGGTWTDIFQSDGWASRAPVLAWLIVVEGLAVLAFPIAFVVFRPLADRGWLLSKVIGLLLVGLVTWLLASLELMAFTRSAVTVGILALFLVSLGVLFANRASIREFLRDHWKTVLTTEVVFLAAFLAFVLIRSANPDLWHPWRGGEKPMDLAYLHAVLKSVHMPPYDPWFGGGYINYYYWGQFLVATLIHSTGIVTEVAVNLAVPTFFALTAGLSYSVTYNLAAAARDRIHVVRSVSPTLAGCAGALFVTVLGNLDGGVQVAQSVWRSVIQGLSPGDFDFWKSSRMMPPDPPGHEITEFPFFTFLFADPHAHLMALPFTLLCIGICLAVVVGMSGRNSLQAVWSPAQLARITMLGLAVGALRLLNTWDYPTYLLFGIAAVGLGEYLAQGGLSMAVALRAGLKAAIVFLVGYVAFLPFHMNYETFFVGIETTTNRTPLLQFLAIMGLFVFVICTFCLWEVRRPLARLLANTSQTYAAIRGAVVGADAPVESQTQLQVGPALVLALVSGLMLLGYLLTASASGATWGTVMIAGVLLAAVTAVGISVLGRGTGDAPITALVALMAGTAFTIVIGLDFVRVEGDIDRMNSVFKFYLQVWVLLAICAAYMVWRLASWARSMSPKMRTYRKLWLAAFALLVLSSAVFPVLGTRERLRDRFYGNVTPLTLDGLAFVKGTTFRDPKGPVDLEADVEGIRWLRENVRGSPVVLEANTEIYNWGGRISIYTGLPSVVGWRWHQEQQRWGYRSMVAQRIRDVNRIYSTVRPTEARALLDQYDVRYIYVGQLERLYYPAEGLAKFDGDFSDSLRRVLQTDQVSIYEVLN